MPEFKKEIMKPGRYTVVGLDGTRREEVVTKDRLKAWAESFAKMRSNGLQIPAPWGHKMSVQAGESDSILSDPRNNAGFWKSLEVTDDGTLVGVVDIPREEDAAKIGTTIREVSPLVRANWVDGLGNQYDEALTHIALCVNPVVPGQANFEGQCAGHAFACSLSGFMGQLATDQDPTVDPGVYQNQIAGGQVGMTGTVMEAVRALRAIGLDLPPDTHEGNFLERVTVAARAYIAAKRGVVPDLTGSMLPGNDIRQEQSPVIMSETIDPKAKAFMLFATNQAKADLDRRIERLRKTGRMTDQYYEKHIRPLRDSFQLDLDDSGNVKNSQLHMILEALEDIPIPRLLGGSVTVNTKGKGFKAAHSDGEYAGEPPDFGGDAVSDEDVEKIVDSFMASTGYEALLEKE